MAPAGLAAIELAKANGSWSNLDDVEAMVVPDDLIAAIDATARRARLLRLAEQDEALGDPLLDQRRQAGEHARRPHPPDRRSRRPGQAPGPLPAVTALFVRTGRETGHFAAR